MTNETDEAIERRLKERFDVLDKMTRASIMGSVRSFIVSGAPGLGKSYTIEKRLLEYDPDRERHAIVKGHAKAGGIYPILYNYREPGNIVVFDDADGIFDDSVSLNILKTATDTTCTRYISWASKTKFFDKNDEIIPKSFIYEGTIIFLTNLDFPAIVAYGHKLSPHFEALMSRSYYIDMTMRSQRECLVRIRQVIKEGLLDGLPGNQVIDVVTFIETNYATMRELSLRSVIKLINLRKSSPDWESLARISLCR